jgi:hypothetical protein
MKKILLAILSLGTVSFASAQSCSELFFSEMVEGSGNNKAIEVYNPTSNPISLSNYRIVRYSNGNLAGTDSLQLTGTIAAHDVWVVANGQTTTSPNSPACDPALQALADQLGGAYPDPLYANGDDAIALVRVAPYAIIDIFGKIGEQPATAWSDTYPFNGTVGAWITKDHTMIRKSTVDMGVTTNPTVFDVMSNYDTLPNNTWTDLGLHNSVCNTSGVYENASFIPLDVYPNPSNGIVTLKANANITEVTVTNMLGEVVLRTSFATRQDAVEIDLSGLTEGVYFIEAMRIDGRHSVTRITRR